MRRRNIEKAASLILSSVILVLAVGTFDWHDVGIYHGCTLRTRLVYPFFHAGIIHAVLNVWCFVALTFIYDIRLPRMLAAYAVAVTVPSFVLGGLPTVGLSGMVFCLFASISFEVSRRRYYQAWMLLYLCMGFFMPGTNALLHLYCYAVGFAWAVLNRRIKVR